MDRYVAPRGREEEVRFRTDEVPTRTPLTSPVPFPCSQSYKHQPPAYCDPNTNITAINEKTGATLCKNLGNCSPDFSEQAFK